MFADESFFDKLPSNPWVFLGLACVAVLSILLTIFFYLKSVKEREPCFSIRHSNLIHDGIGTTIPALEIHYRGVADEVKNFSVTKVRIWNRGKEPIRKADVVKTEPFGVAVAAGCIIYDADIIQEKHQSNNFTLSKNQERTKAFLSFDHMAREEGVVIQILHSGRSKDDVQVTGKLVDGGAMTKMPYTPPLKSGGSPRGRLLLAALVPTIFGLVISMAGVIMLLFVPPSERPPEPATTRQQIFWILMVGTIVFGSSLVLFFWIWYRARPSKGFEKFDAMP